jgi:hypothetical protein
MHAGNLAQVVGDALARAARSVGRAMAVAGEGSAEAALLAVLSPPARALLLRAAAEPGATLRLRTLPPAAFALELREMAGLWREPGPGGDVYVIAVSGWVLERLGRGPAAGREA